MTVAVRIVAVIVLAAQLSPLGLPLLCPGSSGARAANCEQEMQHPASGPTLMAATTPSSCPNSAFCAVVPNAVTVTAQIRLATSAVHRTDIPSESDSHPRDPATPLPPPPQA